MFRKGYDRTGGYYGRFTGRLMAKPELKFLDVGCVENWAPFNYQNGIPSGVSPFGDLPNPSINLVPKGNGPSEMIGRRITVKQVLIAGRFQLQSYYGPETVPDIVSKPPSAQLRIALVLDKQCNGQAATVSDVCSDEGRIQDFLNPSNSKRFVVMGDYSYDMNIYAEKTGSNFYVPGHFIDVNKKFNTNIKIEFSDQTEGSRDLSQVKSNNLFLLVWINNNFVYKNAGGIQGGIIPWVKWCGKTRIKYTDA